VPELWGLAEIIAKWALYLGLMGAFGTIFNTWVFKFEDTRSLTIQFANLGLVASLLVFFLKGASLTGDARGMIDPEMLGLLWSTANGPALIHRVMGLLLVVMGLYLGPVGRWISLAGGLLGLWSFAHVGHVSGLESIALSAVLMLHLIAVAFWVGILIPLKRLASNPLMLVRTGEVAAQFGRIASIFVPVLVLAGGVLGYFLLGSFTLLVTTGYGQVLIVKLLLVGALLSLAAINKLGFVPEVNAGRVDAADRLARSISLEWICGVGIFGATAVLTSSVTLPM